MSLNPLVSVIIPNFNHAPFLQQRIDSVLQQTFEDFEVIILDDKSTDNSIEIIEMYRSHPKVVHIEYNEVNSGSTFKQWQKGLEFAKGEWIWIAESDDVASEQFIEELLKKKGNSELIYCNSEIIDSKGLPIELYGFSNMPSKETYSTFSLDFQMTGVDFLTMWMKSDNFIPNASAVIFKRSVLSSVMNEHDIFQVMNKMKLVGDWYFWLNILNHTSSISYSSESLNQFRNHTNNVRSRTTKNSFTELGFILSFFKKKKINYKKTIHTYLYRYFNRNQTTKFTLYERGSIIMESIRYGFFFLYMKSWIKNYFL